MKNFLNENIFRYLAKESKGKMDNGLKADVLHQLKRGGSDAIPGHLLAQRLGYKTDRAIRQAIRELIADGIPIIGSAKPPYGYYIAETTEEARQELDFIKGYIVENAYRRRDFKRAARTLLEPQQLKLILK